MAKMIPDIPPNRKKSSNEFLFFHMIREDPGAKNWTVLHSYLLDRHVNKRWGEIDFVVLAPELGIFCVEIKSKMKREDGQWYRYKHGNWVPHRGESPFSQARGNAISFLKNVVQNFDQEPCLGSMNQLLNYGVVFGDVLRNDDLTQGMEIDQNQILFSLDKKDVGQLSQYIKKLHNHGKSKRHGCILSKEDEGKLRKYMSSDFELKSNVVNAIALAEEALEEASSEQFENVHNIHGQSLIIRGAAGTGKTHVAIEIVKAQIAEGKTVLFCAYNHLIGNYLERYFEDEKNCTAGSLNSILASLGEEFKIAGTISSSSESESEFYNNLPGNFYNGFAGEVSFDVLIVDEGQDLFVNDDYLFCLDAMLKGGFKNGWFRYFADFEKQSINTGRSLEDMISVLNDFKGGEITQTSLRINCRNTRRTGLFITSICDFDEPPYKFMDFEGVEVKARYARNQADYVKKLEIILTELNKNVRSRDITVLTAGDVNQSSIYGNSAFYKKFNLIDISNQDNQDVFFEKNVTCYTSIKKFKGMENKYIVVTDIESLDEENQKLLYTGFSRATFGLYAILKFTLLKEVAAKLLKA